MTDTTVIPDKTNGAGGAAIPVLTAGSPAPIPQPKPQSILRRPVVTESEASIKEAAPLKKESKKAKSKAAKVIAASEVKEVQAKFCPTCGVTKPLSEFPHSKKNGELKPRFACKPCYKLYTQEATKKASEKSKVKKAKAEVQVKKTPKVKKTEAKVQVKKTPKVKKAKAKVQVKKASRIKMKPKKKVKVKTQPKAKRRASTRKPSGSMAELQQPIRTARAKAVQRVKDLKNQAKALNAEIKIAEAQVMKIDKLAAFAK